MTIRHERRSTQSEPTWSAMEPLARLLRFATQAWSPAISPDGSSVAYVCDSEGIPSLCVSDRQGRAGVAQVSSTTDPVLSVAWSPGGDWLAYSSAIRGGVRAEITVARADGSKARRVAGNPAHAIMGSWSQCGSELLATVCSTTHGGENQCVIIDAATGRSQMVLHQRTVVALSISGDNRFLLVRSGTRGRYRCRVFDRLRAAWHDLLPMPEAGSADGGIIREDLSSTGGWVAYLLTDAGGSRRSLVAVPFGPDGRVGQAGTIAARDDSELESIGADPDGRTLILLWNVDGCSELERYDARTGERASLPVPGSVVSAAVVARDGRCCVVSAEGPQQPRGLWYLDMRAPDRWQPVTQPATISGLVEPIFQRFESHDGLLLNGWLYPGRPIEAGPRGAVVVLHGGPEGEERPGFRPEHQILAASGFTVFAPNIRGSSGSGRSFEHADDRYGRNDAIGDVASCAKHLVTEGLAVSGRIAVAGRSYGGYATLMTLIRHGDLFRAGIDVCGMSNLLSFFAESEPWIAEAAVTKYGDPVTDSDLLRALSPIHHATNIVVPVLIVHGVLDTNVPVAESRRMAETLSRMGRDVDYLEVPGEGHEFRDREAKLLLDRRSVSFLDRVFG